MVGYLHHHIIDVFCNERGRLSVFRVDVRVHQLDPACPCAGPFVCQENTQHEVCCELRQRLRLAEGLQCVLVEVGDGYAGGQLRPSSYLGQSCSTCREATEEQQGKTTGVPTVA